MKLVPINRILIETDSPYLAPEPYRGHTNYPQNIKVIAQALRKIKEVTLDEVAETTTNNVHKIYNLYK